MLFEALQQQGAVQGAERNRRRPWLGARRHRAPGVPFGARGPAAAALRIAGDAAARSPFGGRSQAVPRQCSFDGRSQAAPRQCPFDGRSQAAPRQCPPWRCGLACQMRVMMSAPSTENGMMLNTHTLAFAGVEPTT